MSSGQIPSGGDWSPELIEAVSGILDEVLYCDWTLDFDSYVLALIKVVSDQVGGDSERGLPIHRTEAGWPRRSRCDGGGCPDCTDRG